MMGELEFPVAPAVPARQPASGAPAPADGGAKATAANASFYWDSDGFSFGDLLDVINPLQHLPIISTIYRDLTDDDIGAVSRVAGGVLYGGVIGLAVSLFNVLLDAATGKDAGEHAMAMLKGGGGDTAPDAGSVMLADAGTMGEPLEYNFGAPIIVDSKPAATPAKTAGQLARTTTPAPEPQIAFAGGSMNEPLEYEFGTPPERPESGTTELASVQTPPPLAHAKPNLSRVKPTLVRAARPAHTPFRRAIPAADHGAKPFFGSLYTVGKTPPKLAPGLEKIASRTAPSGPGAKPAAAKHAGRPPAAGGPWVAQTMMHGLDKYRAMIEARQRAKSAVDMNF